MRPDGGAGRGRAPKAGASRSRLRLDPYQPAESKSRERRYSRPVGIDELLAPWLAAGKLIESKRGVGGQVMAAWNQVVGELMARRAKPVRYAGQQLTVEVSSMVHLHELKNFTGEGFRRAVNQRMGAERIERVVFQLRS